MTVMDKIAEMLDGDELETAVALRLILELLIEDRATLLVIKARQADNPSLVWFFRHKSGIALPMAAGLVVAVSWLSSYLTPEMLARLLLGLLGLEL